MVSQRFAAAEEMCEAFHPRVLQAKVFVATNLCQAPVGLLGTAPSKRYLQLLKTGCRDHNLSKEYIAWTDNVANDYSNSSTLAEPTPFLELTTKCS